MRRIVPFLLCLALGACTASSTPSRLDAGQNLSGDWRNADGAYYCLNPDGVLGLPGQTARSGLTWEARGNVLILRTLDMPGSLPREENWRVSHAAPSRLELQRPDGRHEIWRKAGNPEGENGGNDEVRRLEGVLTLPPGAVLPPDVTVVAKLFFGSDMASSLTQRSGKEDLRFRVHYLARQAGAGPMLLEASVLHETSALFATPQPVPVPPGQNARVPLEPAAPGESDPPALAAPAQFQGTRGSNILSLYLEANGLFLLIRESATPSAGASAVDPTATEPPLSCRIGRWRQIDRNHAIQLSLGADKPLIAVLRPAGGLVVSPLSSAELGAELGGWELQPAVLPPPEAPVRVTGVLRQRNGHPVLEDCASGLPFAVDEQGPGFAALQRAANTSSGKDSLWAECSGTLRRGVWTHTLQIRDVRDAGSDKICPAPYAAFPLEETYWRLLSLGGQPVQSFADQATPHLILQEEGHAVGSDGCNNLFLGWQAEGRNLRLEQNGSTLAVCPQGGEQAQAIRETLNGTAAWSIRGSVLELLREDEVVAAFEAVPL